MLAYLRPAAALSLIIISIIAMAHGLPLVNPYPFADSAFYNFEQGRTGFFPIVNFTTNAFFSWRFDPLLSPLIGSQNYLIFLIVQLTIFAAGLVLWQLSVKRAGEDLISIAAKAIITSFLLLYLWGFDTVVISSLAWFPWVLALSTVILRLNKTQPVFFLFLLFCSVRLAKNGCQLAPLLSGVALLVVLLSMPPPKDWKEKYLYKKPVVWIAMIVLAPAIYALWHPTPIWPDYPLFSHVVPDDGLPGHMRPLLGSESIIPAIDRSAVKSGLFLFSAIISLLLLFSFRKPHAEHDTQREIPILIAFILALSVIVDCLPMYEWIAQIGPLETISRIIPGYIFIPLSSLVLAIALTLLISTIRLKAAILVSLLLCLLPLGFGPSLMPFQFIKGEASKTFLQMMEETKPGERVPLENILISPSYAVINSQGSWILEAKERVRHLSVQPIVRFSPQLRASHREDLLPLLTDRDRKTRWSPMRGAQHGIEWVAIYLSEPQDIDGIMFNIREFFYDFPRGIRISFTPRCEPAEIDSVTDLKRKLVTVSDIVDYQGPLNFTPNGFPYFELPEQNVKIVLSHKAKAQCVLIEQTGDSNSCDWSIGELNLLGAE